MADHENEDLKFLNLDIKEDELLELNSVSDADYFKYDYMSLSALQREAEELLGAINNEQLWQKGSADFDGIRMHEQNMVSLREELFYVQNRIQELTVSQRQHTGDYSVDFISPSRRKAAEQCLIDNGISQDEAGTVLQALGYILLNQELYPSDRQQLPRSNPTNDAVKSLIKAMVAYGYESCWTDGDLFDALTDIGVTKEDLQNAGLHYFIKNNFADGKTDKPSIDSLIQTASCRAAEAQTNVGDLNNSSVIRVGEKYIFTFLFNDGDCEELQNYDGCTGSVTHKWEKQQYVGAEPWEKVNSHGGLYEIVFEDGSEFDVYGDELQPVQSIDKKKLPFR